MMQAKFQAFLMGGAAVVAVMSAPATASAEQRLQRFDIPAQSAATALNEWARQSGVQVTFPYDAVEGRSAPTVRGVYTRRQALERLTQGLGLDVGSDRADTVTLRKAAAATGAVVQPMAQSEGDAIPASEVEEIVVTGSRLQRTGAVTPIPVTIVGEEQIQFAGATNLDQIVNDIPALGEGLNSNTNFSRNGDVGTSLLNLRGLGVNRTLVLVDGRRHVGSVAGDTSVDINTIPVALIDRVEVSTGGASVSYGADGVSGVVNIILKDHFEGVKVDAQYGLTGEGDGASTYASITAGTNFADGRGNATLNLSYNNQDAIAGKDRDFIRAGTAFGTNPANVDGSDGVPAQILYDNTRLDGFSPWGVLAGLDDGTRYTFDNAGALRVYDPGVDIGDGMTVGGDGLELARFIQIQSKVSRFLAEGRLNYEFSPAAKFFLDAKYVNVQGTTFGQGMVDFVTIQADNAFLPNDPRITDLFAANPGGVELGHYTDDLGGVRRREAERNTFRVVTGLRGELPGTKFTYEGYYQYGRSDIELNDFNNRLNSRFDLAIDAVTDVAGVVPGNAPGAAACRATLAAYTLNPGGSGNAEIDACQPINLFGNGRSSQAAIDYVRVNLHEKDRLEQHVANFTVNGDLFQLPAGAVKTVAGVEWRRESSSSQPDNLQILDLVYNGSALPVSGSYQVFEGFAEASVPLLANLPFAELLSVEGGVRLSNYSTIGNSSAWRVGGEYAPVKGLRFRGGYSVAVRAPNIGELYTPTVASSSGIVDPCSAANLDLGPNPAQRRANCATLVPVGYVDPLAGISKPTLESGNPDLREEQAKTFTVGAVFTPTFLKGFSATVDYFDIEITDAVDLPRVQTFADSCVDFFSNTNNDFCAKITRDPVTGQITQARRSYVNVASIETRGVDFDISYRFALEDLGLSERAGSMALRLYGTYLDTYDQHPSADPVEIDVNAGELAFPKWRFNAQAVWRLAPVTLSWSMRYVGEAEFDVQDDPHETTAPQGFGAQTYHDVQGRWDIGDRFTVFAGVNNLFDKQPPRGSRTFTTDAPVLYEQIGRYVYAGASARF